MGMVVAVAATAHCCQVLILGQVLSYMSRLVHHPVEGLHVAKSFKFAANIFAYFGIVSIKHTLLVRAQHGAIDKLRLVGHQGDRLEC